MASDCYFDARTCYEDGLSLCSTKNKSEYDELKSIFLKNIDTANYKLAELNISEAEFACSHGNLVKAIEHLELVKTLTYDLNLREKADILFNTYNTLVEKDIAPIQHSSCGSCSGSFDGGCSDNAHSEESLPLFEYYELLIQQLPLEQYHRYAELGEEFAYAYSTASKDQHNEALDCLEKCSQNLPEDIFLYEKGKILHRLGNDTDAELCFNKSIHLNHSNSLGWLALALLQMENSRFQDALDTLEIMITDQILPEQSLLLRAEILEVLGENQEAVDLYVELLKTVYAKASAEKLYGLLQKMGRNADAAVIMKQYLNKSCH